MAPPPPAGEIRGYAAEVKDWSAGRQFAHRIEQPAVERLAAQFVADLSGVTVSHPVVTATRLGHADLPPDP
ncbi:MAG: hypothetical protein ACQSGP_02000 [Frankia sp.]